MKVLHYLNGIQFEWDSSKASINLRKHGVSFEASCELFFDPFLLSVEDELVDDEVREAVIGITVNRHLLYVVYTLRGDVVRIISARPLTFSERKQYEDR